MCVTPIGNAQTIFAQQIQKTIKKIKSDKGGKQYLLWDLFVKKR